MPEITISQVEYSNRPDGPILHIFGRDKDGNSQRLDVMNFYPYFYAPFTEENRITPEMHSSTEEYRSIRNEPLMKIYCDKPSVIYDHRDKFTHYEGDIHYTLQFLIDTKIKSGVEYPQSPCSYEDLVPKDLSFPARFCIIDIECDDSRGFPDSQKDPICCITVYDSFTEKYSTFLYAVSDPKGATARINKQKPKENGCFGDNHRMGIYLSEKSMLEGFAEYIQTTDPDILTGWNFGGFDMPYIHGRMEVLGLKKETLARLADSSQRMEIRGRQIFDLLAGYKRMHLGEQPSYRLDAIAAAEIGQQKVRFPGKVSDLWRDDPVNLVNYNFTDVQLCVGINEKDKTIEFHRYVAQYVGCDISKTTNSMPLIDVLILREAHDHGYILPSKSNRVDGSQEGFEGATVIAPAVGVQDNVIVLDLKSLYPMSMMTVNASPETKDPNGELRAPNGIRFKKHPDGLVRRIQERFLKERDDLKRERNKYPFGSPEYKSLDMRQDVVKINMNSYYGVSGNPMFRLFDKDVAAATTSIGRAILEHNKKLIEECGYKIVQGDSVGKDSKIMLYNERGEFKFYGTISEAFDNYSNLGVYKNNGKEYCAPLDVYTDAIDKNGKLVLKRVKYIMRHDCGKKMYRVSITNKWSVDVTEDHSLIGYRKIDKRLKNKPSQLVEVKPTEIGKGINSIIVKKLSSRSLEDNYEFPKEVYELMGYFIGCGSFETNNKRLSLAAGEDLQEVLEKIFIPLERKGWISRWYIKSETKGDICFFGNVAAIIKIAIRVGAIGKRIPEFIYKESNENQCSFLRGLFSSDGTCMIRTGSLEVRYCSIYKNLCYEIQSLLHMVGISSSVFRDNTINSYNGIVSGTHSHLVNIKSLEGFSKNIGFIENRKQSRIVNHTSSKKVNLKFVDYDISKAKSVEEIEYAGSVYDLEVEDTHNFFANNILVHNTDGVSVKIPSSIGREGTMAIARDLEKLLNDSYQKWAEETLGADVQYFSVKFEKLYERFFSGGKKKRYAGLLVWKEGVDAHEVTIVGFETERSDSPKVTRDAMKLLISMVLEGKKYEEIQPAISEIVRKYRAREYPIEDIGIPGGIGKDLDSYDRPDAQVRAAVYSNQYLGTHFGKASKPKRLYIKSVPSGYPRTDVVAFEYGDEKDLDKFKIDIETMVEKTLKQPISRILEPIGFNWNDFDPCITTLKKWGFT